jgi:hypothetical protein
MCIIDDHVQRRLDTSHARFANGDANIGAFD